jgi:hypothetical protein
VGNFFSQPLPLASYQLPDLRASAKRLVGCYPEVTPPDGQTDNKTPNNQIPIALRRWPGITGIANTNIPGDSVRGMWEMAGTQYAVIGSNFYSVTFNPVTLATVLSKLNGSIPITGNGFVKMTDNGACLVILQPGTTNCWTYTPFSGGGGFQTLTATFFQNLGGAIDCWYVDTFIVFLANNNGGAGSYTFFNDDGRQVSGNAQITFTTAASFSRQFGTDPFYGICVDHRQLLLFGSRSTEGFVNTGNAVGTPFSAAADTYMPYGVSIYGAYTIALQDNTAFWLCNDLSIRRREGQTPARISNPGIEAILQQANQANQLTGAYAMTPTWHGHPMYILTIPLAARTLCYDCLTQQWWELTSIISGHQVQWRVLSWYNGFGLQLVGDSLTGQIGFLDPTTELEFGAGNPVTCAITLQPIYQQNKRITTWRTEAVVTAGQGFVPAVAPKIMLNLSDNWGQTFYTVGSEDQTLGVPGDTDNRAQWFVLGQHRSLVQQIVVTDSTPLFTVDVTSDYEVDDS